MYLDYSKLSLDSFGRPEVPDLELQTLDGRPIGNIPYISNLKFHIKFSELSEMSFEIPRQVDGSINPLYDSVTGYKLIYTQNYGVYVVMDPAEESNGISDTKTVSCFSREKLLETKRFYLAEGTYNFYNPASPNDTLLGMILEGAIGWSVGYVSPSLVGRYRTFDDYDDYLLSFIYGTAPEKYRCVFVFDPYDMKVNVYDADEERPSLPIYLDFDNLVTNLKVTEISNELVTAMRPYGADELDIRAVNPIGTNWIYNISYFIENGSIDEALASKWSAWQGEIKSTRATYNGLVGLQASTNAALIAEKAKLTDMNGELDDLTNQQSVTIQTLATEKTEAGKTSQQKLLDEINAKIASKKAEISQQETGIANLESRLDPEAEDSYAAQIASIANALSFEHYFSDEERHTLSQYLIEQDMTDQTFVATSVNTAITGATYNLDNTTLSIADSSLAKVYIDEFDKTIYTVTGGSFKTVGALGVSCDIVRGTLEVASDDSFVMSIYAGAITTENASSSGGMLTISGTAASISDDATEKNEDDIVTVEGTSLSLSASTGALYLTADVNEYQKYSVQLELLDHATKTLADVATPTYEFSVDSGNFIFAKEFEPFKNSLELGKGIYLRINDDLVITPIAIELEFDFENQADFSLVFSNRFKRHDNVATLKEMLDVGYSSGRNFKANEYLYNHASNQMYGVTEFMNNSIDAAVNTIKAASNQSVVMDGAGLHIGGDGKYQMRLVDKMLAMTDDNWSTAKLAIGLFNSPEVGEYWGVNADVIGGKLIVGNNLIVENDPMSFRVDSTGAWLYNSTFILQDTSTKGQIMLHPKYGFAAGDGEAAIYTTGGDNGTEVMPLFINNGDEIEFDDDGMPVNTNFFLDLRTGKVYIRGNIYAEDGVFNGTVYAKSGKFEGVVQASDFLATDGTSMLDELGKFKSDYLDLGNIQIDGTTGNITMSGSINMGGNITLSGDIVLGDADSTITWGQNPIKSQFSPNGTSGWSDTMRTTDYYRRDWDYTTNTWGAAYQFRGKDGHDGSDARVPNYITLNGIDCTLIDNVSVSSPSIYGGIIAGADIYGGTFNDLNQMGRLELNNRDTWPAMIFSASEDGGGSYNDVFTINSLGSSSYSTDNGFSGTYHAATMGFGGSWTWNMRGFYQPRDAGYGEIQAIVAYMGKHIFEQDAVFDGYVDFTNAKVTGLYAKFK